MLQHIAAQRGEKSSEVAFWSSFFLSSVDLRAASKDTICVVVFSQIDHFNIAIV